MKFTRLQVMEFIGLLLILSSGVCWIYCCQYRSSPAFVLAMIFSSLSIMLVNLTSRLNPITIKDYVAVVLWLVHVILAIGCWNIRLKDPSWDEVYRMQWLLGTSTFLWFIAYCLISKDFISPHTKTEE